MPAKDFLDLEEKKNLQKALKEEERAEVRERILMFLLLNDGKTQREIAEFIGCSLKTVAHWCVHGDPNNLESLEDGRKNGNHKKATEEYINLLLKIVDEDPKELGYEFGRWTAARLAEHLEKETGIKLSGSQVRRILRRKKYVYIWAKYSLEDKQDKKLRKAFGSHFEVKRSILEIIVIEGRRIVLNKIHKKMFFIDGRPVMEELY